MGRGSKRSIANAAVNDVQLQPFIISELCKVIRSEIKDICSIKHDSILRMKTRPAVEMFTWDRVWSELEEKTPLLLKIVRESLPPSRHSIDTIKPALCTCVCILLKLRNPHMNLVQGILSIVLRAGNANKQVNKHEYIQRAIVCLLFRLTEDCKD